MLSTPLLTAASLLSVGAEKSQQELAVVVSRTYLARRSGGSNGPTLDLSDHDQ